jgi:predicted CXXCH cytochrome family protein
MKTRTRRCVICGRIYYGFGQLAAPVAEGRCCDACHAQHVAPERMRQAQAEQGED